MTVLIADVDLGNEIIEHRRRLGHDHRDEVWDGVYFVSPNPNNQHQRLISRLSHCFVELIEVPGLGTISGGPNVTDRRDDWTRNYRCPDLAVYLRGNPAIDMDSHWLGGPDLAIEVVSPGDRSREKFGFYAAIGTREVLIVDRDPWALELYRLEGGSMMAVGRSTVEAPEVLASAVVPASFRLVAGPDRPAVVVRRDDPAAEWTI